MLQIRRANLERQRLSRLQKKEIGLATMLFCVVVVFFFCNILALVVNVLESFHGMIIDQLVKTSNLLVTINSSVNFVIYVIYGEKFKRLFLKLFCPHGKLTCGTPAGGRDSPECDSVVSNGDGRTYSVRSSMQLQRTGTSLGRNGSRPHGCRGSHHRGGHRGVQHAGGKGSQHAGGNGAADNVLRPYAGLCVYYPQIEQGQTDQPLAATAVETTVLDA